MDLEKFLKLETLFCYLYFSILKIPKKTKFSKFTRETYNFDIKLNN